MIRVSPTAGSLMPLWKLQDVTLNGTPRPRLRDVTVRLDQGVTAIVGYSGAGKSSLLSVLAGMEQPDKGVIETNFRGQPPAENGEQSLLKSGVPLFWAPETGGLWPHMTVREHLTAVSGSASSDPQLAALRLSTDKLLSEFDLTDRQHALPGQLSQGEQSRLAVTRALAASADVLLLDEPLTHVDPARRPNYWDMIRRYVGQQGTSLVFTTHEPEIVLREAQTVICLDEGQLAYHGSVARLYDDPPDERAASFLGPVNWFSEQDSGRWLSGGAANPRNSSLSLRPECVEVTAAEDSSIEVVASHFCGSYAETQLRCTDGEGRTVIHRPASATLKAGQRVKIEVRREVE